VYSSVCSAMLCCLHSPGPQRNRVKRARRKQHVDFLQDWQLVSSTKAVRRYYPPEVRAAVTELLISRERHQVAFVAWTPQ
jgi:hypothetical protein